MIHDKAIVFSILAASAALVFIAKRVQTAQVRHLMKVLNDILAGNLNQRLRLDEDGDMGRLAQAFNRMVEKLEADFTALSMEKEDFSRILRSMVEEVIAVDSAGKILYLNPAAEKMFAVQSDRSIGKSFLEVIRQAAINAMLAEALDRRREVFKEVRLFLPEERVFEAKALPIRTEEKDRGVLLVLHDISQVKQLEEIRKDFVANVSHELRTPLTSIQGYAETLLDGALSDDQNNREFVQTIHDQAERLSRLVNDLLDLSAIESGRKPPKFSNFALKELIREVEGSLTPLARKRQVRIENRTPDDLPPLAADRDQIKQVLINLIDNAIKFNRKDGAVTVDASASASEFTIAVRDTGAGIPESDLPRVFERFYRVDKGRSRQMGGTGLGLAIVKHIIESHGGTVRAESAVDQGSVFIVQIPRT